MNPLSNKEFKSQFIDWKEFPSFLKEKPLKGGVELPADLEASAAVTLKPGKSIIGIAIASIAILGGIYLILNAKGFVPGPFNNYFTSSSESLFVGSVFVGISFVALVIASVTLKNKSQTHKKAIAKPQAIVLDTIHTQVAPFLGSREALLVKRPDKKKYSIFTNRRLYEVEFSKLALGSHITLHYQVVDKEKNQIIEKYHQYKFSVNKKESTLTLQRLDKPNSKKTFTLIALKVLNERI